VLRERQRQLELPLFNVAAFKNQEPLRNYYQLLALDASASAEDVKKAFRREIAKYHPDKVQHLGQEFQAMAAALAADLTEAHRILWIRRSARRTTTSCAQGKARRNRRRCTGRRPRCRISRAPGRHPHRQRLKIVRRRVVRRHRWPALIS